MTLLEEWDIEHDSCLEKSSAIVTPDLVSNVVIHEYKLKRHGVYTRTLHLRSLAVDNLGPTFVLAHAANAFITSDATAEMVGQTLDFLNAVARGRNSNISTVISQLLDASTREQ